MRAASEPFEARVADAFLEAEALLLEKHRGYGPKNISNAPGGPLNGLLVRLHDKLARISNMREQGITAAAAESMRDTAIDIANYGIIMLLVLDGNWPAVVDTPVPYWPVDKENVTE